MIATLKKRWPWLAAAAAAALLLFNQGARTWLRGALEFRSLSAELQRLKGEEVSMQKDLHAIQTSDLALEKAARKDLGLVKPGDVEYRIPKDQTP